MESVTGHSPFDGDQIYTSAQSWTGNSGLPPVMIAGKGSKPRCLTDLQKKAKKKRITQALMLGLIDIAKQKKDDVLLQAFWNTYHCQDNIITHQKRTHGKYCKNRFCTICSGNRKAQLIEKYHPILKTWEDPKFVTITIRSVAAYRLPEIMKAMNRAFRLIKERNRKRHSRGKGIKLIGIKSLESNFNPKKRTYNPHFHVIVPNMAIAEQLVKDWLNIWTGKHNAPTGQNIRNIKDLEGNLVEVIKYNTKIFTDPDPNDKKRKGVTPKIYMKAMYNIISAMKGERIFERFGFNLPKNENNALIKEVTDYDSWLYDPKNSDWFSEISGQAFSNYKVDASLQDLLMNRIDTNHE